MPAASLTYVEGTALVVEGVGAALPSPVAARRRLGPFAAVVGVAAAEEAVGAEVGDAAAVVGVPTTAPGVVVTVTTLVLGIDTAPVAPVKPVAPVTRTRDG